MPTAAAAPLNEPMVPAWLSVCVGCSRTSAPKCYVESSPDPFFSRSVFRVQIDKKGGVWKHSYALSCLFGGPKGPPTGSCGDVRSGVYALLHWWGATPTFAHARACNSSSRMRLRGGAQDVVRRPR